MTKNWWCVIIILGKGREIVAYGESGVEPAIYKTKREAIDRADAIRPYSNAKVKRCQLVIDAGKAER